jgi:ligand-binding sensor domain-containing protein
MSRASFFDTACLGRRFYQNRAFSMLVCCACACICPSLFALDPRQSLAELYHSSWNARQGVTGNVTALAQTTDGYLWIGTTNGLLRFDGISFEQYQPEAGSLMAASVSALMAVPDGGLWVGFARAV